MQKYTDKKGNTVEVCPGLGGVWIVGRRTKTGGAHRVKSKCLPVCLTQEECQCNLDFYAKLKKWQKAE